MKRLPSWLEGRLPIGAVWLVVWGMGLLACGVVAVEAGEFVHHPNVPPPTAPLSDARQAGGTLVIVGGGGLTDDLMREFIERAGGSKARIVVIPTGRNADAPELALDKLEPWHEQPVAEVRMLHAHSREEAEDPAFVAPLRDATGVWLGGGDQMWFAQTYGGTQVQRELHALLERGGAVGGTSAGAAIMSGVAILGGRDPVMIGQGFNLIPGAIVDQHFLRRNRLNRLLGVLERHPDRFGLGIDERTGVIVHLKERRIHILGSSYVLACVPDAAGRPSRIQLLGPGDQLDLDALRPAALETPVGIAKSAD